MRTELGVCFPWRPLMTRRGPSGTRSGLRRMWGDPEGLFRALPFLYEVMGESPPIDTQQRANEKGGLVSRSPPHGVGTRTPSKQPTGASRDKAFIPLRLLAY